MDVKLMMMMTQIFRKDGVSRYDMEMQIVKKCSTKVYSLFPWKRQMTRTGPPDEQAFSQFSRCT